MSTDKTTVGLSSEAHQILQELGEQHFGEMTAGYRFAIALALAFGSSGTSINGGKKTFVNVGTLDRDGTLRRLIMALHDCAEDAVYATGEELAEWGVREMGQRLQSGTLDFADLLDEASRLCDRPNAGEADEPA